MNFISGGISGAISNPMSSRAQEHASLYYEEIRHRTDDVAKIAKYTGFTPEQILAVKNYLFVETHILSTGVRRFDPCFEIAESWQRLADAQEYVQPHDKLLIPHELMEMSLISRGASQTKAHEKTSALYNYPKEASAFYKRLQLEKHARLGKGDIISDKDSQEDIQNEWESRL